MYLAKEYDSVIVYMDEQNYVNIFYNEAECFKQIVEHEVIDIGIIRLFNFYVIIFLCEDKNVYHIKLSHGQLFAHQKSILKIRNDLKQIKILPNHYS